MSTLGVVGAEAADAMAAVHAAAFLRPWGVKEITSLLAAPGAFALSIGDESAMNAFIVCWTQADEAEVLTLAVRPDCRRQGMARALLNQALERAAAAGAKAMILEVATDNVAGQALYAARGFRKVGRRPAYYAGLMGRNDALVLRLDWG